MSQRAFYLVAYDISHPARLRRVGAAVKAYLTCGQKSVPECWMTPVERELLFQQLSELIAHDQDRIHAFRLDPRQTPLLMGTAQRITGAPFIIS
ncbi:CRISPR-associated endonuclease Cas2 [Luteithermobacter gelatinilyticus]|uniref:CRISPR-associated endonuclease Cas2 n=1 Tax=Luteithermobacter gelatinilyticus TaxID=2582913 RepID=UPI00143DE3EB|nr:CRISPR-associated endonuclease Cas2 [Luteithermobacter gelatinilyticus]